MSHIFISESLTPLETSFHTVKMSQGEPGLPRKFRWRNREWHVAEVLENWKEYGNCTHGSGERYLRKHGYRFRTTNGLIFKVYFQRSFGRSKSQKTSRWRVQSIEASALSKGKTLSELIS